MISEVVDPLGRSIGLTKSRWGEHIVEEHPELGGQEDGLKETIENPDFIYRAGE